MAGRWRERALGAALLLGAAVTLPAPAAPAAATLSPAQAAALRRDGALDTPLAPGPADAARGRAIVADRQRGMCLLCHSAPLAEERFQGNLAGDLRGVGRRWTAAQLRARLVDAQALNPDTPMPPYYREPATLARVAPAFAGRTLLDAQQIEDVIAFLLTLRD